MAVNFYKDLFSAQADLEPDVVLDVVQPKVSSEMNDMLTIPFTANEVE